MFDFSVFFPFPAQLSIPAPPLPPPLLLLPGGEEQRAGDDDKIKIQKDEFQRCKKKGKEKRSKQSAAPALFEKQRKKENF